MQGISETIIGVYNEDLKENQAFLTFTKHFFDKGLKVPEVLEEDGSGMYYLLSDLGDETLFSYINTHRTSGTFPGSALNMYKKVLKDLPAIQIQGGDGLDYTKCYPRDAFDRRSIMWDLNYFKYYFLKLGKVAFDEQELENDFESFAGYLEKVPSDFFLYRDFQSRNIMIKEDEPWYIDYQGGRKGALQYDVASLLFDSKANIPFDIKVQLFEYYKQELKTFMDFDDRLFTEQFYAFVYVRLMQAMGAYGYRGFFERKTHFLQSVPFALKQLKKLLKSRPLQQFPYLNNVLNQLIESPYLQSISKEYSTQKPLDVEISSFSYKRGLPVDDSGHGGGFIFDCRCLHNPGRYDRYKHQSGLDEDVINFLEQRGEASTYLSHVFELCDQAVDKYLDRGFDHLQVNFGCTGGRHRSVFSAEKLKEHLHEKFGSNVAMTIHHTEKGRSWE